MKFLEKLLKPVREGNAYRATLPKPKYSGSLADTKKLVAKQKAEQTPIMCTLSAEQKELYKASFAYWDEWTGARFARRESPYLHMDENEWAKSVLAKFKQPKITAKSICRSNPVTGGWQPIDECI